MAYGTDGSIAALSLVVLADTKDVQPVYEPAPVVRQAVLRAHPHIKEALEPAFATLTPRDAASAQRQDRGRRPGREGGRAAYLKEKGLPEIGTAAAVAAAAWPGFGG